MTLPGSATWTVLQAYNLNKPFRKITSTALTINPLALTFTGSPNYLKYEKRNRWLVWPQTTVKSASIKIAGHNDLVFASVCQFQHIAKCRQKLVEFRVKRTFCRRTPRLPSRNTHAVTGLKVVKQRRNSSSWGDEKGRREAARELLK